MRTQKHKNAVLTPKRRRWGRGVKNPKTPHSGPHKYAKMSGGNWRIWL